MVRDLALREPVTQLRPKHLLEQRFYTVMAVLMIATSIIAFAPAILNPASRRGPLSALAAVHGSVFFAWLALFLVQVLFVGKGLISWHRKLGIASIFLLTVMVPVAYLATVEMVRRGYDLSGDLKLGPGLLDVKTGSVFNFFALLKFTVLVVSALCFRRRPGIHKRLMLFGNIQLMSAPVAHLLGHIDVISPPAVILCSLVFCLAAIAGDYAIEKRLHPLTLGLAGGTMAMLPIEGALIGPSSAWHRLVGQLAGGL